MITALIRSNFLRRMFIMNKNMPKKTFSSLPKIMNPSKLLFMTNCTILMKTDMQNMDLNFQQACDLGEQAIMELMDVLQERIMEICKAYKDCLKKQIEIIKEASELGPLSGKWDDLPEYRSLAVELSQELSNFTAALNTIGQMAHEETMKYITHQKKHVKLIANKHKELEAVLKKQTEEIKKLEANILKLNKESILKAR